MGYLIGLALGTGLRTFLETRLVRSILAKVGVPSLTSAWLTFLLVGMADTIFLSSISSFFRSSNADGLIVDVVTLLVWLIYDIRNARKSQQAS
jgi:hypothetical protein